MSTNKIIEEYYTGISGISMDEFTSILKSVRNNKFKIKINNRTLITFFWI